MSNASFACFGFSCCVWITGTSQADLLSSFSVLISPAKHAWDTDRRSWLAQLCGTRGPDLKICTFSSMNLTVFSVELILTAPVNDPHPLSSHPTQHPYSQPHHQGAWELITLSVTCTVCPSQTSKALAAGNLCPFWTATPPPEIDVFAAMLTHPLDISSLDDRPLLLTIGLWVSLGVRVPLKSNVFCRKPWRSQLPHVLAVAPKMSLAEAVA